VPQEFLLPSTSALDLKVTSFFLGPEDLLERDGKLLPHETGFTLDTTKPTPREIMDAEQGYCFERLANGHIKVGIYIVNPYGIFKALPELFQQVNVRKRTEYENGRMIQPMVPLKVIEKYSLVPDQKRPTLTISVEVDPQTGKWSQPQIFESVFTNKRALTTTEAESYLELGMDEGLQLNDEQLNLLLDAVHALVKRLPEKKRDQLRHPIKKADLTYTQVALKLLSELAGEVLAEQSFKNEVPVMFINDVHSLGESKWPQSTYIPPEMQQLKRLKKLLNIQMGIKPNDEDWLRTDRPFGHTSMWYNKNIGVPWYARCTAPLRDVRSLISVLNWSAYLRGEPPLYLPRMINELARNLSLEKPMIASKDLLKTVT